MVPGTIYKRIRQYLRRRWKHCVFFTHYNKDVIRLDHVKSWTLLFYGHSKISAKLSIACAYILLCPTNMGFLGENKISNAVEMGISINLFQILKTDMNEATPNRTPLNRFLHVTHLQKEDRSRHNQVLPEQCAIRDLNVYTAIERNGLEETWSATLLAKAFEILVYARGLCYAGKDREAIALYDALYVRLNDSE